jgi:anti-anti-sigma factor
MSMNYAVRQIGDVTVLDLSGRISPSESLADRLGLQDLVRKQLNTAHNKILLNLSQVAYINSSGIAGLLASWRDVTKLGGELRVCDASNRVGDLLRRINLDSVLNLDNDEPTALQGFSRESKKETSAA